MAVNVDIKGILERRIASGLLFYAGAKTIDIAKPYARKYLKEHAEGVVGIGVPLLVDAFGLTEKIGTGYDYVDAYLDALNDYGFMREFRVLVDKEMVAWAQDANTIVVKNADDLANATVIIDGTTLVPNTDYTVSGDTISLANPLAKGKHKIIIIDGTKKKALEDEIVV